MARFDDTVSHVPGKLLTKLMPYQEQPQEEVEWFVDTVVAALPASAYHLKQYKDTQDDDSTKDVYIDTS